MQLESNRRNEVRPGIDHNSVGQTILSDENVTNVLISKITEEVDKRVQHRESRRQKTWNIVYVLAGLIGVTAFTSLINITVSRELKSALKDERPLIVSSLKSESGKALNEETAKIRQEISDQATYQEFAYLTLAMDLADGFSVNQRDDVVKLLELISKSDYYKDQVGFPGLLEKVIDALMAAGQDAHLERVTELFESETISTPGIVISMVDYHGRKIIGSTRPPERWDPKWITVFSQFESASKANDDGGSSLPYRMLIEFAQDGSISSEPISQLLRDVSLISPAFRARIILKLFTLSNAEFWQRFATPEGKIIERLCQAFLEVYDSEILELLRDEDLIHEIQKVTTERSIDPALESMLGQMIIDAYTSK